MGHEIFEFTTDPAKTDLVEIIVGIVESGLFKLVS